MILNVCIYETELGEKFKVHAKVEDQDDLVDVTDQYDLAAAEDEHGRKGFVVIKSMDDGTRHPTGAEL